MWCKEDQELNVVAQFQRGSDAKVMTNPKGEPNEMDRNQILDRKVEETERHVGIAHIEQQLNLGDQVGKHRAVGNCTGKNTDLRILSKQQSNYELEKLFSEKLFFFFNFM